MRVFSLLFRANLFHLCIYIFNVCVVCFYGPFTSMMICVHRTFVISNLQSFSENHFDFRRNWNRTKNGINCRAVKYSHWICYVLPVACFCGFINNETKIQPCHDMTWSGEREREQKIFTTHTHTQCLSSPENVRFNITFFPISLFSAR